MSASESKITRNRRRLKSTLLIASVLVVLAIAILLNPIRQSTQPQASAGPDQADKPALATAAPASQSSAATPATAASPVSAGAVAQAVPTEAPADADDAAANQRKTLASLKKIDDYPLYTMTYYGSYDVVAARARTADAAHNGDGWACSLFAAFDDDGQAVYGRNFDWEFSPAVLLFMHPPDGYASIAMVDMAYLGFTGSEAAALSSPDQRLLDAPRLPFDGMNEYGLTVGMASVRGAPDRPFDAGKATVGSLGIIRVMLDHAKNTEEALALMQNHNIDFTGGPPLHYLIADPSGHSATVEFIDGAMHITRNNARWQIATNFFITGASDATKARDRRYATANTWLQEAQGRVSPADAMGILQQIQQDITQWSIVYDMRTGDVNVAMARNYEKIYSFHLDRR